MHVRVRGWGGEGRRGVEVVTAPVQWQGVVVLLLVPTILTPSQHSSSLVPILAIIVFLTTPWSDPTRERTKTIRVDGAPISLCHRSSNLAIA